MHTLALRTRYALAYCAYAAHPSRTNAVRLARAGASYLLGVCNAY